MDYHDAISDSDESDYEIRNKTFDHVIISVKGALSGVRQFLATENPFKMTKNAFYFTLKVLCVLKILKWVI